MNALDFKGLSNTATPKYYGAFRKKVLAGTIPVCRQISKEMNRIDALIRNPEIFYAEQPVESFVNFCNGELTRTDGEALELLDSFKLWGEQLFGWYYADIDQVWDNDTGEFVDTLVAKRLIKKQYLVVARGAAKSMYASCVQAYYLIMHPQTTHQVVTAPTMRQADEILAPIRTAIARSRGPVFKFLTAKFDYKLPNNKRHPSMLGATKEGIVNFLTGSIIEIRPMSVNKLQGLRSMVCTIDEWLSGDTAEDVVGALEQSASKLPDYLILAVSSEGTVRGRVGDTMMLELQAILNGEYVSPHTSIFAYRLDSIEEVAEPKMWLKAHPNLGITVGYDAYRRDVERAENIPSASNDIIAKRFGIPMEGHSIFFTYEEIQRHNNIPDLSNHECALGVDLSLGDDFCSFAFLFPYSGSRHSPRFGLITLNFISRKTLDTLPIAARLKYEHFIEEGSLLVLPGEILDMSLVFEHLEDFIDERDYLVETVGYDPYNADQFLKLYYESYGQFKVEPVRQGAKTASVPLGEIKKLATARKIIFDQQMVEFAMGNTMVIETTTGVRRLFKRRHQDKIDPVAAAINAFVVYKKHLELFDQ